MRMLALPAALLLGSALYTLLPGAKARLEAAFLALLGRAHALFTTKRGRTDSKSALAVFLLGLAAAAMLLCAVHPAAAAVVMAPLFPGFSVLPAAMRAKRALDGGDYAGDIPGYERRVLDACAPMGDAFAGGVVLPLVLCALGCALHVGGALAWAYAGLDAAKARYPAAGEVCRRIARAGECVLVALLHLCAGVVGRNPLTVGGRGAGEKLMRLLGLEGKRDHAPIAGDITQAIFLCCLCTGLIALLLTAALMAVA